jgi:hypothetical protein
MGNTFINKLIFESVLYEVGELTGKVFSFHKIRDTKTIIQYEFESTVGAVVVFFKNQAANESNVTNYQNFEGAIIYNVGYEVNGTDIQATSTTYQELTNILSTIFAIIQEVIKEKEPDVFLISGNFKTNEKDITNDSIKSKLYGAIINKQLSKLSIKYHLESSVENGVRVYILYK